METVTSLFTTKNAASAAGNIGPGITKTLEADKAAPGSGGFGIDRFLNGKGDSQQIPFVGPVVSVFQAFNDERDARNSAARLDFNAKQEELIGRTQTVTALRQLNETQAMNVVNAFTSGGGLSGSRGRVTQDVNRDAELGFDLIKTNAEIRAGDLRQKARTIRKVARFDRNAAIGKSLFRFVSQI